MGRLIDADVLIEKMNRVKFQTNISEEVNRYRPFLDYADVLRCINEQPTAYDLDKVVAELTKTDKVYGRIPAPVVLRIVRKGGVDND